MRRIKLPDNIFGIHIVCRNDNCVAHEIPLNANFKKYFRLIQREDFLNRWGNGRDYKEFNIDGFQIDGDRFGF